MLIKLFTWFWKRPLHGWTVQKVHSPWKATVKNFVGRELVATFKWGDWNRDTWR